MLAAQLSQAERRKVRRWEDEREAVVERVALTLDGKMLRVGGEWFTMAAIIADLEVAEA